MRKVMFCSSVSREMFRGGSSEIRRQPYQIRPALGEGSDLWRCTQQTRREQYHSVKELTCGTVHSKAARNISHSVKELTCGTAHRRTAGSVLHSVKKLTCGTAHRIILHSVKKLTCGTAHRIPAGSVLHSVSFCRHLEALRHKEPGPNCSRVSRERFRGRSSESTPKEHHTGMSSSPSSMLKTYRKCNLMLMRFMLVANKPKEARHGTNNTTQKSSWPCTLNCITGRPTERP